MIHLTVIIISSATECIIARLLNLQIKGRQINVHVKDVAHQTGTVDCAWFICNSIYYIGSIIMVVTLLLLCFVKNC